MTTLDQETCNQTDAIRAVLHDLSRDAVTAIRDAKTEDQLYEALEQLSSVLFDVTEVFGQHRIEHASMCVDCGVSCMPQSEPGSPDWQRYMVTEAAWTEAGSVNGWLCVACLEKRLGRPLTGGDFPHLESNRPGADDDVARLAELKAAAWHLCDDSKCVACIRHDPDRNKAFGEWLDAQYREQIEAR